MNEINVGDRVTLKSGGPVMTVINLLVNDMVECTWHDHENGVQKEIFNKAELKLYRPPIHPISIKP